MPSFSWYTFSWTFRGTFVLWSYSYSWELRAWEKHGNIIFPCLEAEWFGPSHSACACWPSLFTKSGDLNNWISGSLKCLSGILNIQICTTSGSVDWTALLPPLFFLFWPGNMKKEGLFYHTKLIHCSQGWFVHRGPQQTHSSYELRPLKKKLKDESPALIEV